MAGLVPATHEHPCLPNGRARSIQCLYRVYIMASRRHGTVYTGVSGNLIGRVSDHREGRIQGFTKKYAVQRLVWYEHHELMTVAIQREKSIKKYPREWKINLIERENPNWDDLFLALVGMKRQSPAQGRR